VWHAEDDEGELKNGEHGDVGRQVCVELPHEAHQLAHPRRPHHLRNHPKPFRSAEQEHQPAPYEHSDGEQIEEQLAQRVGGLVFVVCSGAREVAWRVRELVQLELTAHRVDNDCQFEQVRRHVECDG